MPKAQKSNGAAPLEEEMKLPLFFKAPHLLDRKRHGEAGLKKLNHFRFAEQTNSVPVAVTEFVEIARSYPIVLTDEAKPTPVAVLGLRKKNNFLDKNGRWLGYAYVPAYVRKYPFALVEVPEQEKFALCVDEGAEHYMESKPDMPFYKDGDPAELCREALQFCGSFQKQMEQTTAFTVALKEAGLLKPKETDITLPSGEKLQLGGFLMVDEEGLQAMQEATVIEWQKRGWLSLLSVMIMSQINWKYLLQFEV